MKLLVQVNSTSVKATIEAIDSSVATGAGLGSVAFNSSGITAYYFREGDSSSTAISLVTMTIGTWASGGLILIDGTNMKGLLQVGLPNACFTALGSVVVYIQGVTNLSPIKIEIQVVSFNPYDAVRMGLTALPNVASGSAGAIPTTGTGSNQISVSSGQVIIQSGTGAGQLNFTSGVVQADAAKIGGTSQTGRDLGASVLLSSGTGTGQLNITSGVVQADVAKINGVSTSPVTAISANIGTTQPLNFTGTGTSALVKGDAINIGGSQAAVIGGYLFTNASVPPATLVSISGKVLTFPASTFPSVNCCVGQTLRVSGGTGIGQTFKIVSNTTNTATIDRTPATNLASDSNCYFKDDSGPALDSNLAVVSASVTGNVGGNVNGNVAGSVNSVSTGVTVTTNNDKTGYDLVNAPNSTALTAIGTAVWASGTRTLSSFGTLVADTVTAVWAATVRTLSSFGFTVNTNANATETAIKAQTDLIGTNSGDSPNAATAQTAAVSAASSAASAASSAATAASQTTALAIRSSVGLASATLDMQLAAKATVTALATAQTGITAIQAKTDNLPASPAAVGSRMDLIDAPNATALTAICNETATVMYVDGATNKLKVNADHTVDANVDESGIATAVAGALSGTTLTIVSPLSAAGDTLEIVTGDSYTAALGNSITFNLTGAPGLIGSVPHLRIDGSSTDLADAPAVSSGTQQIVFNNVSAVTTSALATGNFRYQIRFMNGSSVATVIDGTATIKKGI